MIRGLLALGDNYEYTGCTRSDLREKNRVAQEAVAKLAARQFIDSRMFNDAAEIMKTFADYDVRPGSARPVDSGDTAETPVSAGAADPKEGDEQAVPAEPKEEPGPADSAEQENT